ncbi:hypothetical protein K504DRAFT_530833 [Pleomassaria siparia CBS 279.74]|uniref:Rhodopsin domain-containing protein n=1 Tax=Pleomassaria siparia CBS 279.74 TaxID=1314801 RepID=A0A6G1KM98_9PLEO|nr:hypothetical protein K504DRAFT_530833 [Pleomassaria siparia CBS 279.74]
MAATTGTLVLDHSSNIGLYLIPVCILAPLVLGLCVTRIYTRLARTKGLALDDWTVAAAALLSTTNVLIAGVAVSHGWGHKIATFSPSDLVQTMKLQFAVQTVWILTLCLVRVSVALSLLRFGQERAWRWTLYFLMAFQILISSSYIVIQFGQCRPVSSNWEQVADVTCWDITPIIDYGWAISGVYVLMDLILTFMPIRLVLTLTRTTSEKILISCLMALGLLATTVLCIKMTTFNDFGKGDPMQATIKSSMLAKIEEQAGIIAACLPCLKSSVEQLLKKLGILKEHQLTRPSFVNTLPMAEFSKEDDGKTTRDQSITSGKGGIRVDSVSLLAGGSTGSLPGRSQGRKKDGWEEV